MGNLEEYKKFKNTGIFVVLFGVESSQVYGFTDTPTRLTTWAAKFKQKYDTTQHNTTQHNTWTCTYSHILILIHKDQNTRAHVRTHAQTYA